MRNRPWEIFDLRCPKNLDRSVGRRATESTLSHPKVMAIIHGSGYIVGKTAASFENAAPLSGIGHVIIVSMIYRESRSGI